MGDIDTVIEILDTHERKFRRSFSLIPSENTLSPLARLAFLSDGYSRYFFDENEVFGQWSFQGGSIVGQIQRDVLMPLLRRIGKARHVDVRANSGLGGMTLALMAFGRAGSGMISVPPVFGGHPDTKYVGARLGMTCHDLPFTNWASVDLDGLAALVARERPSLLYLDHATALACLDWKTVIATVREATVEPIHIHVDTSHVNGLVWGGEFANPLDCGADTYGGSTHKTFAGPHKAVLFANDDAVFDRLTMTAVNTISHHHMASVVALAISMIEFETCNGRAYAAQIVRNAVAFAQELAALGFSVQGGAPSYTSTHQVWIAAPPAQTAHALASRLFDAGVVVNPYNPIPSLGGLGIRMGVNEATRLGLKEADLGHLARLIGRASRDAEDLDSLAADVADFRAQFRPEYCFGSTTIDRLRDVLATNVESALPAGGVRTGSA